MHATGPAGAESSSVHAAATDGGGEPAKGGEPGGCGGCGADQHRRSGVLLGRSAVAAVLLQRSAVGAHALLQCCCGAQ